MRSCKVKPDKGENVPSEAENSVVARIKYFIKLRYLIITIQRYNAILNYASNN